MKKIAISKTSNIGTKIIAYSKETPIAMLLANPTKRGCWDPCFT